MKTIEQHSDIINLWPSVGIFADDIKKKETTCRGWKQRDSIPSKYWLAIIPAAKKRGFQEQVTFEVLVKTSKQK